MTKLIGPFSQVITLGTLSMKGPLRDADLHIIDNGGILVNNGQIVEVGSFEKMWNRENIQIEEVEENQVALPGFIDCHTHICFEGSRAGDFAARNAGQTYLEIAKSGGGIWSSVKNTRAAHDLDLVMSMTERLDKLARNGIVTVEVKSGYGLSVEQELKMLRSINMAGNGHIIDVITTCLAAHIVPKDYQGNEESYLDMIISDLVPAIKENNLCNRFDIFIEEAAFGEDAALKYLQTLKADGFQLTVHGDQFTPGGSKVAVTAGALSVDHLEASGALEIEIIANSDTSAVALPGASIGLGCDFAPARRLLDAGCSLAIASDWNPGSAPQGSLLSQASVLSCFEKLSAAEVFAGLTFRAAKALGLEDRGRLIPGQIADIISFPADDYREILYHQGELKTGRVWKKGDALLSI